MHKRAGLVTLIVAIGLVTAAGSGVYADDPCEQLFQGIGCTSWWNDCDAECYYYEEDGHCQWFDCYKYVGNERVWCNLGGCMMEP